MANESQDETIAFLASARAYGAVGDVRKNVTHISVVLLAGTAAIKLKRAVRLPYLDFSTAERRLAACEAELCLNRRTAPALYRAVRRVTREADGRLALDGDGPLVDAIVEMARFDENMLFDRLAAAGKLDAPLMADLAQRIADFHAKAEVAEGGDGAARLARVIDDCERALRLTDVFPASEIAATTGMLRDLLKRHAPLLDGRARAGKVRRCHGDLHLRNICLIDGVPTLFDCLEFDEELATVDLLYDLAFLVMDLWHRDLPALANVLFNRYLDLADEEAGLAALPLFLALRATIRAHVTAAQVADAGGEADAKRDEALSYWHLAHALAAPPPARLIAVGGLSGSGKSTVAAVLAPDLGPAPGARVLSSDRIRKALFGEAAETRLPPEAYRPDVSENVYGLIAERAALLLKQGHAVIADAVHDRAPDRERLAAVAAAAGVRFDGLWLTAPLETLLARVAARRGDPSDATTDVVRAQARQTSAGAAGWRPTARSGNKRPRRPRSARPVRRGRRLRRSRPRRAPGRLERGHRKGSSPGRAWHYPLPIGSGFVCRCR